ncbi:hypothetical protein Q73A0000_05335 [Kaistella flava (ex Peng et al. 2021)]|uniref:Plasmid transfer protein n=1 Tax=Kaistella flava (ex Peng et al. 2021) TaxID=2038776 RepID=A0A7M2Y6F3_9FLAO|nr:hypothetical protein [Kaistella flava (ex Peng et al. 2021)]QOW09827.1 hypothetical protein Q73A0000_05335 [Kaistella flava (ex Peng et al. 2021)]
MKKITLALLTVIGGLTFTEGQTIVINDQLIAQLTKNQAVRLASNESFLNSYEKQKKLYNDINQKIAQVVAIQEFIYDKLTNINSAIKQGKQLYYLSKTFVQIGQNANDVLALTAQHPEYAILMNRFYIAAVQELLKMQAELTQDILHEENDFLMDPYDRQVLIQNLSSKAQMINGYLICIKIRLKNAKKIPYIYQIPTINTYVNLDRAIVKKIIIYYQNLFN